MSKAQLKTTEQTAAAAPARRTRPRGLSVLHQEQIEDSRHRILKAAETAFAQNSYVATTVDMIINIAGVSRATFYKYFTNKFDVAKGLIDIFIPKLNELFDALPDRPGVPEAKQFMYDLLKLYRANKQFTCLLGEVQGSEPGFFPNMMALHDVHLERLGKRIPVFRRALEGKPDSHLYVLSHLQILHLYGFANMVVSKGWQINTEAGVQALAEDLVRFVAENE
jgi:AcrR family transcriptional regulator